MHFSRKLVGILNAGLLAAAAGIFAWVGWPPVYEEHDFSLPALHSPWQTTNDTTSGVLNEGVLTARIAWPRRIHLGESFRVTLSLQPTTADALAELGKGVHLLSEARLDFPLMHVSPAGGVQQPVSAAGPLAFYWTLMPGEVGIFEGQLWLYLVLVNERGETDRQAALSVPVSVRTATLFGLQEQALIWVGGVLAITALGLTLMIRKNNK